MPDEGFLRQRTDAIVGHDSAGEPVNKGYLVFLLIVATGGWGLSAYDFNLQVMAMSNIASSLHLSSTQVGLFGFFVDFAELIFALSIGRYMDRNSRRTAWLVVMAGATVFTGLTFFVHAFWQLCIIRAIASGFAYAEQAVSITLVNEALPIERRGIWYSIVQGGWPLGVMFAAVIYLITIRLGWNYIFLFGVAPFAAVVVARLWIREPERFRRIKQIRQACDAGDDEKAGQLSKQYDVPVEHARTYRFSELFTRDLRKQTTLLAISFFSFGAVVVATNVYIVYWLTHFNGFSDRGAVYLMLGCAAIGFWLYPAAGWLGEYVSRRKIMAATAALVPIIAFGFMWVHSVVWSAVVYFFLYQVTNGTWSGAGYTYIGESFPTRLRGTGAGFIDACTVSGFVFGAAVWTGLIHHVSPQLVWGIDAVLLSCGQLAIWFAKDFDPKGSLM